MYLMKNTQKDNLMYITIPFNFINIYMQSIKHMHLLWEWTQQNWGP